MRHFNVEGMCCYSKTIKKAIFPISPVYYFYYKLYNPYFSLRESKISKANFVAHPVMFDCLSVNDIFDNLILKKKHLGVERNFPDLSIPPGSLKSPMV